MKLRNLRHGELFWFYDRFVQKHEETPNEYLSNGYYGVVGGGAGSLRHNPDNPPVVVCQIQAKDYWEALTC